MARFGPRVRILNGSRHLGDAVERDGHDARGDRGEPLEPRGEYERRGEHEDEQEEVHHVQVLEGHLGAHDSLHVLECLEAPFQVMVDVERAALAHVTQPARAPGIAPRPLLAERIKQIRLRSFLLATCKRLT